ncbi:uncharacterized protein FIBRA_01645 [Fibroporia radiculosa]|uniref:Uncharacterized protein n=1 Tax=Fibroporia radiculosa TaxID=599839 RepID=J4I8L6_9APHY|nr:uncharacterized protein FIBRA_01645 [Fibroporia radiculosa]CCL99626.1 predicted protein [Fibroporia radiculosa]
MVATFEWAEILAQAATDREDGDYYSVANAFLYAYTILRKSAFTVFCERINMDSSDVHPDSKDYKFFEQDYQANCPDLSPPAFFRDMQNVDHLLRERGDLASGNSSRSGSPPSSIMDEGDVSG